jgi:plastocyanin
MKRTHLAAIAALAAFVVPSASALGAQSALAAPPKLTGTVGPGFTIVLTQGGKKVKTLKAGKYTFVITDKSPNHNYNLDGPNGWSKDFTTVPFVGTKTFTVTLKKGKYKYYCMPHESFMFGNFTVS